jgi:3-dehydroquinate synthase
VSVTRIPLRHPGGLTRILAGSGALDAARAELDAWAEGRRRFVLTTPRVLELHRRRLDELAAGGRSTVLEVPDGETAKSAEEAVRLWRDLLAAGGKRDSRVVVVGGGSACDLGGFVAGCFLRGVEVAHVPTTLLAQVDAAIGGKTGIDLPEAKNSVGVFHHPALVVCDARFLATLPVEELRSGLVEVVKMALLLDADLLAEVEHGLAALLAGSLPELERVVAGAAAVKARVVERDPGDKDERRLLNLGHTLGHAIEAALDYRGLRHGEAVGYGLLFALRLGERRGLPREVAERVRRLLRAMDLPALPPLEAPALLRFVSRDKKAQERGVAWVVPVDLLQAELAADVPLEELRAELERFLRAPLAAPS